MIAIEQFQEAFPRASRVEDWVAALNALLPEYNIDTIDRTAAFLAQCGHETAGWTRMEENLNYSVGGLMQTFPKYFPEAGLAYAYARQPVQIANRVYANRMGNGPEESADGWRFRGRGPIHLTGRNNYTLFAQDTFENWQDIVSDPDVVATDIEVATLSALWFWDVNNLNDLADRRDIEKMTRKINGGYNGLDHRIKLFEKLLDIL